MNRADNWFRDDGASLIDLHPQPQERGVRSTARRGASRRVDCSTRLATVKRYWDTVFCKEGNYSIFLRPNPELFMGFSLERLYSRAVRISPPLTIRIAVAMQAAGQVDQQHDNEPDSCQNLPSHQRLRAVLWLWLRCRSCHGLVIQPAQQEVRDHQKRKRSDQFRERVLK
jgi:hypothetical protein